MGIVLEMTAVVSVDSTALNVLEDVVNDFRGRGIQIAFAMVGNRLDRTFRKSGLTNSVGEKWFFPTVHDAVVGCLRHQKAKRKLLATVRGMNSVVPSSNLAVLGPGGTITDCGSEVSGAGATGGETDLQSATDLEVGLPLSKSQEDLLDIEENPVHMGNEIGFSNDVHHSCTVIFINMKEDVPMIMSDITAIFQRRGLTICRANIEAMDDERVTGPACRARGASHVYHIRSLQTHGKLQDSELLGLKKDLLELWHCLVDSPR